MPDLDECLLKYECLWAAPPHEPHQDDHNAEVQEDQPSSRSKVHGPRSQSWGRWLKAKKVQDWPLHCGRHCGPCAWWWFLRESLLLHGQGWQESSRQAIPETRCNGRCQARGRYVPQNFTAGFSLPAVVPADVGCQRAWNLLVHHLFLILAVSAWWDGQESREAARAVELLEAVQNIRRQAGRLEMAFFCPAPLPLWSHGFFMFFPHLFCVGSSPFGKWEFLRLRPMLSSNKMCNLEKWSLTMIQLGTMFL